MGDDNLLMRLELWEEVFPEDMDKEEGHLYYEAHDRIKQLMAERDKAYARGYSDAETEISKSALGQRNDFLHSQYANAADRIEALTAERDRLASLNVELCDNYNTLLVVRSRLQDRAEKAEADNARLQNAIDDVVCGRGMFGLSADDDLKWAMQHLGSALNTGKEVMPVAHEDNLPHAPRSDIGPGDQAVAGAAPVTVQALIDAAALRKTLHDLITEQSEGEWDDKTIAKDVEVFLTAILALIRKGDQP